jgi:hypothetical protein
MYHDKRSFADQNATQLYTQPTRFLICTHKTYKTYPELVAQLPLPSPRNENASVLLVQKLSLREAANILSNGTFYNLYRAAISIIHV